MKKKILAIALSALIVLPVFAGCAQKPTSGSAASTAPESATAQEEQIVLKWYTESDETTNKNYGYDKIVAAFHERYPNVTVEVLPLVANTSSAEYQKKVDLMLASDEQIDIINFAGSSAVAQKVKSGVLTPLNEFAEKSGVDIEAEYRGVSKIGDSIYCLPNQYAAYVVFINEDLLKEAGLSMPPRDWTWADYKEYAEKMTKGEGRDKVYGSYFHTWTDFYQIGTLGVIPDNMFYKEDGSANFDHPAFRTWMEYLYDLGNKEKCQMSYIDIKTQNIAYRNLFFSEKVAMLPMGTWMLSDIKDTEKFPHTFRTIIATLPRFDETAAPNTTINTAYGGGYAINSNCKHKQEAFDFVRFLTSEGFDIGKSTLSPWIKGDHEGIAREIMGTDESLYDMKSYISVLQDPEIIFNNKLNIQSYDAEVDAALAEESEKFLTGGQDIDTFINTLQERATQIIEKNK